MRLTESKAIQVAVEPKYDTNNQYAGVPGQASVPQAGHSTDGN